MSVLENKYDVLIDGTKKQSISFLELLSKSNKNLVYFYPKDDTPGCTKENVGFNEERQKFLDAGINIIGISKDSIETHYKFACKYDLKNILLSDTSLDLHKFFGAYGEKNNYGKIVQGVIRSTFLLDNKGNILKSFKNVKATDHHLKMLKEILGD